MARKGPRMGHRMSSDRLRLAHVVVVGVLSVLALVGIALIAFDPFGVLARLDVVLENREIPIWALSGVALFFALVTLVLSRRYKIQAAIQRRQHHAVAASEDARMPSQSPAFRQTSLETAIPALRFQLFKSKLPKPEAKYRKISRDSNIVGDRPARILHLWVFENPLRLVNYLSSAWREFGFVHLLRDAHSVTPKQYRDAIKGAGVQSLLVETEHELQAAISGFSYEATDKRLSSARAHSGRVSAAWDRYGSFEVNSLLCGAAVWQTAVIQMVHHADLITMDLAGYTEQRSGSSFEIQLLVDEVPMDKVLWICDPWSDIRYLQRVLTEAWSRMRAGSPNRDPSAGPVRITQTDYVQIQRRENGTEDRRLLPDRRRDRRLAAGILSDGLRDGRADESSQTAPPGGSNETAGPPTGPRRRRSTAAAVATTFALAVGGVALAAVLLDGRSAPVDPLVGQLESVRTEAININSDWDSVEPLPPGDPRRDFEATKSSMNELSGEIEALIATQGQEQVRDRLFELKAKVAEMIAGLEEPRGCKLNRQQALIDIDRLAVDLIRLLGGTPASRDPWLTTLAPSNDLAVTCRASGL